VPEVVAVLLAQRPVEAEQVMRVRDLVVGQVLRGRIDERGRLAGDEPEEHERERDHRDQREHGGPEPPDEEGQDTPHRLGSTCSALPARLYLLDHGSSARRIPSESWFRATTVSRIATVGITVCHGVYEFAS